MSPEVPVKAQRLECWEQVMNYTKGWRRARDILDIREVASLRSLYDQSLEVTDI